MKLGKPDIAIIVTSLLVIIGTAFTSETEFNWVPQDLASIPGFLFLVVVILVGAMLAGRLKTKRSQGVNLFKLHKKTSIFFAILIAVTFAHGIYDRVFHGDLLFWQHTEVSIAGIHGWVGLTVMILALVQVIPSLAIKDRRKLRKLHLVLGYALLILVIAEIMLGVGTAIVELAGD